MDVSKAPPVPMDPVSSRSVDSAATPGPGVNGSTALLLDQLHIEPLDVAGALQILLSEARAALPAAGVAAGAELGAFLGGPAAVLGLGVSVDALAAAPQAVILLFLRALPPTVLEPSTFLVVAHGVEADLHRALDAAVTTVAAWRAVPPAVVAAAGEARSVVLAALRDDPPNPLWLRPEWLGLAPSMERFWRRRRRARRFVDDPDLHSVWRDTADSYDGQAFEPPQAKSPP